MLLHDRAPAFDLSHWLGPLSPAFAAMGDVNNDDSLDVRSPGPSGPGSGSDTVRSPEPLGSGSGSVSDQASPDLADLRTLFHTLNNQLGVILTYAELLEAKAPDQGLRTRAAQIVSAAIDALGTTKELRKNLVKS
jgi:hypothetical protein